MNSNEKMNDIVITCNQIRSTIETAKKSLRQFVLDLSDKISQDNAGTRSNKHGALSQIIESTDVLSELSTLSELIIKAVN